MTACNEKPAKSGENAENGTEQMDSAQLNKSAAKVDVEKAKPTEDGKDHVALPDTQGPEVVGRLVGEPADVAEGEPPLVALGVAPDRGGPVGLVGGDLVDHVVSEVVVVGVLEGDMLQESVLAELLVDESLVEVHHLDSPFITDAMNLHPFLDVA